MSTRQNSVWIWPFLPFSSVVKKKNPLVCFVQGMGWAYNHLIMPNVIALFGPKGVHYNYCKPLAHFDIVWERWRSPTPVVDSWPPRQFHTSATGGWITMRPPHPAPTWQVPSLAPTDKLTARLRQFHVSCPHRLNSIYIYMLYCDPVSQKGS